MSGCLCFSKDVDEVHVLDYRHSNLDVIPSDVFKHERTLEELLIDSNGIKELPRELFCCHGLKKLTLSDNEVRSIPPAVASLINLEHLDISKNGVVDVPDNIKFCKNMKVIEASVNPLGKLPECFTQLHQLTELYLNDAFLDFLPGSFGRLSKLKILEIRENHLKTLPRSLSHMILLQRLDIGNNDFTELPDVVGSLTSLLELWCDTNQIKSLPASIGNLKQLMFLDASKNRVETLPSQIEGCVALADLHLSTNMLQQLPESLGRLSNLTTLKVDDNRLTSLPYSIGGMVSLSELNISANDLERLPPSIGLLRHLRTLYADENFIVELPSELGSCSGLTVLSLRSNNLTYIPDEIGRIPRLRVLNLSDNKIKFLPFSLTRLKELQALWLAENQTKPLIRLQSDIDIDTGQRMLTCYLLPQQPNDDKQDMYSDAGSFHPSLWEEERAQRQQIHFDTESINDEEGKLRRQPTPYPKEMKHRMEHMRNLALKELNVPEPVTQVTNTETHQPVIGRRDSPQKLTSGGSTSPVGTGLSSVGRSVSSLDAERHHLYRADKEKLLRDKARMVKSKNPKAADGSVKDEDDGGFLSVSSRRGGSSSGQSCTLPRSVSVDRNISVMQPLLGPPSKSASDLHEGSMAGHHSARTNVSYGDFMRGLASRGVPVTDDVLSPGMTKTFPNQSRHHGNRSHYHGNPRMMPRIRDYRNGYDSDTGYRSDFGYYGDMGYLSDTGYRSDVGYRGSHGVHRRRANNTYFSQSNRPCLDDTAVHRTTSSHAGYRGNSCSYSNVPMAKRMTIGNDEMYEQYHNPHQTMRAPLRPVPTQRHSSGSVCQKTESSCQRDSLQRSNRGQPESGAGNYHSISHGLSESVKEDGGGDCSADDSKWKAQLYSASVKLQKSPSIEKTDVSKPVDERSKDSPTDTSHVASPPYQPAPPYGENRAQSQHSLYSESSQKAYSSQNGHMTTDRPNTLPINESKFPQPKRELYPESRLKQSSGSGSTLDRSHADSSLRMDCSLVDSNHNTPSKPSQQSHYSQCPGPPPGGSRGQSYPSVLPSTPQTAQTPHTPLPPQVAQSHTPQTPHTPPPPHSTQSHTPHVPLTPQSHAMHGAAPSPWNLSNYEKDVAMFKQLEPASQVSSSTDSGYGHTHLFERTPGDNNRSSLSTASQPSPAEQHQLPRQPPSGTKHVFHVTLKKGPGLGFSIAGGVGSPGNPYRPNDTGIFITRVQADGPGAGILQPSDKILEVNGVSFTHLEHSSAVNMLRNSGQTVSMVIERL